MLDKKIHLELIKTHQNRTQSVSLLMTTHSNGRVFPGETFRLGASRLENLPGRESSVREALCEGLGENLDERSSMKEALQELFELTVRAVYQDKTKIVVDNFK